MQSGPAPSGPRDLCMAIAACAGTLHSAVERAEEAHERPPVRRAADQIPGKHESITVAMHCGLRLEMIHRPHPTANPTPAHRARAPCPARCLCLCILTQVGSAQVRSVPVRKDDEIQVARGTYKVCAEDLRSFTYRRGSASICDHGGAPAGFHVAALRASRNWSSCSLRLLPAPWSCHCHQALQLQDDLGIGVIVLDRCAQGREGKVVAVYRRKWVIHVERITREKVPTTLLARLKC